MASGCVYWPIDLLGCISIPSPCGGFAVGVVSFLNWLMAVPLRPFVHKVCQSPVDFAYSAVGRLPVWATVTVGQAPGNIPAAFSPLPSLEISKGKDSSSPLPGLLLRFLRCVLTADDDVGLLSDFGYLTVMALCPFWNPGECCLHFSGNGIVSPTAAVPGGIKMGFKVADAGR